MKQFARLLLIPIMLFAWGTVHAGSVSSTSVVKDGKKITTKIAIKSNGIKTITVTTKDKKTKEKTVTTTVYDKNGKIVSTDDPNARATAAAKEKEAKKRTDALKNAPRRKGNEPIATAVFQIVIGANLQKTLSKPLFPFFKKHFDGKTVIKPINQGTVDNYNEKRDFKTGKAKRGSGFSSFSRGSELEFLAADVYVVTYARLKDKVGISKATNKLAKAPYLYYRAEITGDFWSHTWEVKHDGHIFQNEKVTKEFADKIKAVILEEIAPRLPADSAKFRRGGGKSKSNSKIDGADLGNKLKNLFKKKKK